jgi:undecaprenyl diphosphate synthase
MFVDVWNTLALSCWREAVPEVPMHIAITMDGNGRWAQKRGKPRLHGHRAGAETAKTIVLAAPDMGVSHLTLFAFSTENWKRPNVEVHGIFRLLEEFFTRELDTLASHGIQVGVIGDRRGLPGFVQSVIVRSEEITRSGRKMLVNIALNYGGRWDIVHAVQAIAADVQAGRIGPRDITEEAVESRLSTAGQPDPDLLIRTGGEQRISNFLLWQSAYSEMYVTPVLWPDFTPEHLKAALLEFQSRHRRFGALGPMGEGGDNC